MIKALILDRDSLITHGSKDPSSPFYYILDADDLVLKPNVRAAFALISSLARHHGFKVILATKQRCIGKGLISRPAVDVLHKRLEEMIDYWFDDTYIEEETKDKRVLFAAILDDHQLQPSDVLVIDDSAWEIQAARDLGCRVQMSNDLYPTICGLFNIT